MDIATIWGIVKAGASYWREILIGLLALGVLWYRGQYHDCEAGRLADIAAAQAKVAAFQEEDARRTRALEDAHAQEIDRIKGEANVRREAIVRAPSSTACLNSPSGRAFIDSLPDNASPGSKDSPGGARAPVSR